MRCKEWSVLLLDVTFFLIHISSFGNSQFQYDINIYRKHNDRGQKYIRFILFLSTAHSVYVRILRMEGKKGALRFCEVNSSDWLDCNHEYS